MAGRLMAGAIQRILLAIYAAALVAGCSGAGPGGKGPGPGAAVVAGRTTLRAPTPFVEGALAVTLEVVLYVPPAPGPHPALVFHHGSTGNGDDPAAFAVTVVNEAVAEFFTARGWAVAFPQRRGRGASGGLYDEGFEPDRSRYSCREGPAVMGLERALADADAALDFVRTLPAIDPHRVRVAGHSRGGLLAVVQAARRPDAVRGSLNFVGGWLGEGCIDAALVNTSSFARGAGAAGRSLWLYARNDPYYSVGHSQAGFDAFRAAGGQGDFRVYERAPGLSGHGLPNDSYLWGADVEAWLRD
jgi:dienelactone hydrolase